MQISSDLSSLDPKMPFIGFPFQHCVQMESKPRGPDADEVARDPGALTSHPSYTDKDFEGHRALTVYCTEPNQSQAIEVIKTRVVDNQVKPVVKRVTKVPNYLPKELRMSDGSDRSDPFLVLRPGDACVQSGITVQFCCRGRGSKPLLFSWFKNDTILKSDENFHIFQSGEELNILEIVNTGAQYTDQYSCVVYNRFGYQWCDFTLEVKNTSFLSNNKMPIKKTNVRRDDTDAKLEASKVSECEVSPKITTNPKHDKHKTRPFVIQRTWAERVAELNSKAQSNQNETNVETNGHNSDPEEETNTSVPTVMSCTIAEREHKKWENPDIDLKDNPYSAEKLNSRIQQKVFNLDYESPIDKTDDNEDKDVDSSFLSSHSKELSRYQRDYYVRQQPLSKEETLRSFDENEYSNSKYFGVNQMQRKSSEDMSQMSETSNGKNSNETESELFVSDSDSMLPSVKDLVNRFSFNEQQTDKIPKLVHSLTARSLTKEFRQMSQLNLPRTQR
ncbi:unnamed protein product, partial [Oppiella nova]